MIAQLTHSGGTRARARARPIIAHHSKFIDPVQKLPPDYPLISDEELERLEDLYVEAAVVCAQWAGFDGVDVKACHRYLISELHASYTRENSRYGGSWENRSRFFRNIVKKIRQAAPGLIVTSRHERPRRHGVPLRLRNGSGRPSKPCLDEPIDLVRFLAEKRRAAGETSPSVIPTSIRMSTPFDCPWLGAPMPPEHPLVGIARSCTS
jgi:hypothetical protein